MEKQTVDTRLIPLATLKSSSGSAPAGRTDCLLYLLNMPKMPSREHAGTKAAKILLKHGEKAERRQDIFLLAEIKNGAGCLCLHFPKSEKIALVFLKLVGKLLALKAELNKNEDLDRCFDEIGNVTRAFPERLKIALECSRCYAALQENNIMSWNVSPSFTDRIVAEQEKISAKFPDSRDIGQIYCLSLMYAAGRVWLKLNNWELFSKYVGMLRNLIRARRVSVSGNVDDFLNNVAATFGI
ncbi:MAG: hypothetical protein LBS42_01395 [Tannerella sp.]|jgi:hypothetical protein|nr:hypothetical protein [Tannerella sp.]